MHLTILDYESQKVYISEINKEMTTEEIEDHIEGMNMGFSLNNIHWMVHNKDIIML